MAPSVARPVRGIRTLIHGAILCREDDAPGPAYVVLSGRLRVFRRDRRNPTEAEDLGEVGPGSVIGEISAMLEQPRSATVQALSRAEIVEIPTARLPELTRKHSALTRVLVLALQERAGMSAEDINLLTDRLGMDLSTVIDQVRTAAQTGPDALPAVVPSYDRTLVYPRSVACPVCGSTFSALMYRPHKAQSADRTSDFQQLYRTAVTPSDYEVWVCPNDLYAALPADFGELAADRIEGIVDVVNDVIATEWDGQRPDFSGDRTPLLRRQSLLLALAIYRHRGARPLRVAGILHRLAWSARENGETDAERAWLAQALEAYEAGFQGEGSQTPDEDLRVQYLCGELSRRLGQFSAALTWFGNVLRHPALKHYPRWEPLARTGIGATRAEMALSGRSDRGRVA